MRMKRTEADTGRWFAVVTPKGKRSREEKEKKTEMMKQVNQWKLGGEEEKRCWNTWLQNAVRQDSLITDAYSRRQKLKIDDKCTDADDVIHDVVSSRRCLRSQTILSLMIFTLKWSHGTLLTLNFQTMKVLRLHPISRSRSTCTIRILMYEI